MQKNYYYIYFILPDIQDQFFVIFNNSCLPGQKKIFQTITFIPCKKKKMSVYKTLKLIFFKEMFVLLSAF